MNPVILKDNTPHTYSADVEYVMPGINSPSREITIRDFNLSHGIVTLSCTVSLNGYVTSSFTARVQPDRLLVVFSPIPGIEFVYEKDLEEYEYDEIISVLSYFKDRQQQEAFILITHHINYDIDYIIKMYNISSIAYYMSGHAYSHFKISNNGDHHTVIVKGTQHTLRIQYYTINGVINVSMDDKPVVTYYDQHIANVLDVNMNPTFFDSEIYDSVNIEDRRSDVILNTITKILLCYLRFA